MVTILIVDDNLELRASLSDMLEAVPVVGELAQADCGEAALQQLEERAYDLVILDIWMPGMGGVACCREIKSRWPSTRVLVLTSNQEDEAVLGCVVAGADGYVVKKSGRKEFLRALDRVLAGDQVLDPEITSILLKQFRQSTHNSKPVNQLTERENEVLVLISRGLTNRQIGESLQISEKTARNYVASILDKLGFHRRSQAAAWASRNSHGPFEA